MRSSASYSSISSSRAFSALSFARARRSWRISIWYSSTCSAPHPGEELDEAAVGVEDVGGALAPVAVGGGLEAGRPGGDGGGVGAVDVLHLEGELDRPR